MPGKPGFCMNCVIGFYEKETPGTPDSHQSCRRKQNPKRPDVPEDGVLWLSKRSGGVGVEPSEPAKVAGIDEAHPGEGSLAWPDMV